MRSPIKNNSPAVLSRSALAWPLVFTGVFLALGFFSRARENSHLAWTFGGVAVFLLGWSAVLFYSAKQRGQGFKWEFAAVRSHYVQALVQFSIYVYWGWYWRNVYAEATLILSQVAFLYALDALLTWSRGQTWRLGFGSWPIIFSTNLFMWFRDDWYVFQFLMVAVGVLGKQFIRWQRDGKLTHIFNPSAFGLTLFSLVLIFTGNTGCTWGEEIAITQGLPPHLYTEIFLCGLVVQFFFSVTLLTFSAAAMLVLLNLIYTQATGVYLFIDSNIPIAVFLGLHLLMTDPATTPRSSLGRIVFGSLYGLGVALGFVALNALSLPEFYDKLVIVPLLNLMTPLLDRLAAFSLAGKFGRWEARAGARKMNLAFMGGWVALFLAILTTGFIEAPHPGGTIGFWKKAAEENRPHALENLRILLNNFERQNFSDATNLSGIGNNRPHDLGILCNQVGSIYVTGKLVPVDAAKAVRFFSRACELGDPDGCANLALQFLATDQTYAAADVSHALAVLETTASETTNGRMSFLVGYAYDLGRGNPVDKIKARKFYERGAALGDLNACKNLAPMLLAGVGGSADSAAAARWLQQAVDASDGASCMALARLYHTGDGVPKDDQHATALLEQACKLGVQPACLLLQQQRK